MKKEWSSIFRTVSKSVKALSELVNHKACHDVVLMTTGISVVTMLTFSAGNLNGNGQRTMVAFAETHMQTVEAMVEMEKTNPEQSEYESLDDLLIGEEHSENDLKSLVMISEDAETVEMIESAEVAETETAEPETTEPETSAAVEETEPETETEVLVPEETQEKEEDVQEETYEVVLSADEYHVLLKIVQAEAGTCDEKGKLLVANVILNRMKSDEFPNTVREVVYQKYQFSPVGNGTINTCKISMETRHAVDRALKGEDCSEGALYFMNRRASTNRNVRWFDNNLDFLFKHGAHEFFK